MQPELQEQQDLERALELSRQESEGGMAGTHFVAAYAALPASEYKFQDQLLGASRRMVYRHSARHSGAMTEAEATAYFERLQAEAFQHKDELLSEVAAAAQRMWTSALCLPEVGGREFCGVLNEAIRLDEEADARDTAVVVHTINQLLVTRRTEAKGEFPPGGTCWRGGGLPDQHRAFFQPGTKFRVPMFLATSFSEDTADEFLYRAHVDGGLPAVKWRIRVDPRGETQFKHRCKHVNFVTRTNVPGEKEFLFAPYSVFTVVSVTPGRGDDDSPHRIELLAAVDNRKEPENLPLAPWS
jgi:hypothetical protein